MGFHMYRHKVSKNFAPKAAVSDKDIMAQISLSSSPAVIEQSLLHSLFESKVQQQPTAVAIKAADLTLTYNELSKLTSCLAQRLIENNIKHNQLVAVVIEKGWEQVVATLGILKSGAAYLPIDPTESKERIHYLLELGEVNIILTQQKYLNNIEFPTNKLVLNINKLHFLEQFNTKVDIDILPPKPDDLAYVIFTSGSTGTPKGVMISHKSAVNTILDINERFNVTASDKVFALSSLGFDLSVYDIFGTLAAGGTIIMPTAEQAKDPTQWPEFVFKEQVSVWNSVPALMDIFIEYLQQKSNDWVKHSLRLVLLSGDWIPLSLPAKIRALFGNIQLISLGGATEGAIWSILYQINDLDPEWKSIPYGKPMKNQSFYILNSTLQSVNTTGEVGELFIGGVGVAKGYWKNTQATNAQFIVHPEFGILYKTGDLGRFLPDGNIEFLGRIDFQVKIAGYRVEISAVEKFLLDFPNIKQAVVLAVKEGIKQKLVSYIIFNHDLETNTKSYQALESAQLEYWQKIYNAILQDTSSSDDPTFNTVGWVSSYMNQPIPYIQMQEWVENTVARIKLLHPQMVLEIGCGTGLLLFSLAQNVTKYDAIDFSKKTLDVVAKHLDTLNINNVQLVEAQANDLSAFHNNYDTIILNSVAQYFPSINYFVNVLNIAVDKIKNSGHIFIGDLRSLSLLPEFHASVLLSKQIKDLSYKKWQEFLTKSIEEEDELAIDSNFFHAFKTINKRVSNVEILLKEGKFHNEMNCYRYDVILYIDQPQVGSIVKFTLENWQENCISCCNTVENIHSKLIDASSPEVIMIKNIPNKRVAALSSLVRDPHFSRLENWQRVFEEYLINQRNNSVDPEIFYTMAKEHDYYASVTWSITNPTEKFDVILVKKQGDAIPKHYLSLLNNINIKKTNIQWTKYANLPLLSRINKCLISKVKKFLQERVPQYMIPSNFIVIKELPITANGKIDRSVLLEVNPSLPAKESVKPRNPLQKNLILIWEKMLGVHNIGIRHGFYELGGTSLLAVQLIVDIYKKFGVNLTLQNLNHGDCNIDELSILIAKKQTTCYSFR